MSIDHYQCPSCSAPLSYNPQVQGFKCEYCGRQSTEEELAAFIAEHEAKQAQKVDSHEHLDSSEIKQYNCPNCAAEVVCGDTTTASFCYYCHTPVILESRLQGEFRPNKIIPFKISQKQAVEKFAAWIAGKKFLPSDFSVAKQKEKIIGVYLPYWDIDIVADIDYSSIAIHRDVKLYGNEETTITSKYKIQRKGSKELKCIRTLAFDKLDQNLINAINPFESIAETQFKTAYLSGFQAERPTLDREEAQNLAQLKAAEFILQEIHTSINCEFFADEINNSKYEISKVDYTLLPIFILNYKYKAKDYHFAVNGQTGKAEGDLPVSTTKAAAYGIFVGIIILVLALLGGHYLW